MMAKLNIWVRDRQCQIIKKRSHLHVFNCRDEMVLPMMWFDGGHTEVEVPPGCYLVTAGVPGGNIYTDMTMVIVKCGDDACVNLVLNDFKRREAFPGTEKPVLHLPLIQQGCSGRILIPLMINAVNKREIAPLEVKSALQLLMKASGLDEKLVNEEIAKEIALLKESPAKDDATKKEIKEHLDLIEKAQKQYLK